MTFLVDYSEKFKECCEVLAGHIKTAIDKVEEDIGQPVSDDFKKICVCFALLHLVNKLEK